MQYRSSKSRTTKQQEGYNLLTELILDHIKSINEVKDAETLWLGMKERGCQISHTTFNNRLRILIEDGRIEKIPTGYRKNFYRSILH